MLVSYDLECNGKEDGCGDGHDNVKCWAPVLAFKQVQDGHVVAILSFGLAG